MKIVARVSGSTASHNGAAGHFEVLNAGEDSFFIRCLLSGAIIGSRSTIESAKTYANGQAQRFDRGETGSPI